jgi:arylsulfatase A-like enzyme
MTGSPAVFGRRIRAAVPLVLLGLLWPASLRAGPDQGIEGAGPNLLLIIADDHRGGSLGTEGDPRKATPNLDRLAREGILFERAYCNSPLCTPSRQSLITGKLPHAVGVTQLTTRLSDDVLTMGEWLRDLDYRTAAIGKMHFNGPSAHGFTERIDTADWASELRAHPPRGGDHRRPWRPFQDPAAVWLNAARHSSGLPAESMQSAYFVDRALDSMKMKQQDGRPFALVVSFYDPHSPFNFPRGWRRQFRPDQFPVPPVSERDREEQPAIFASLTPDEIRGINAAYFTSLAFVDSQVGRLVRGLDQMDLSARTLVVYIGDNGYMLGQHGRFEKHCFYEPAVRIPMILRWPGQLPRDRRISGLVEMVDILPTVLHLLNLPAPPGMQGIDLEPLIRGKPGAMGHDFVFSEYLENEEAMVRSDRFKLIVGTGRRQRQDGYQTGKPLPGPYQRLFDLVDDPGEARDLGADPPHQAVKDDLLHKMYVRMVTTREGLEPIPIGLSRLEMIHWCLIPRDPRVSSGQSRSQQGG